MDISEPDYPYLDVLAPFQPIAMTAVHYAIDTSLNFTQANKLIRELKPATLILPECYTQPPVTHPNRTELVIEQVCIHLKSQSNKNSDFSSLEVFTH